MTRSRTYLRLLTTAAMVAALSACVVRPADSDWSQDNTVSDNVQTNTAQSPYYYRGTTSSTVPVNNDAAINANVIQAISTMPGAGDRNLQVSSLNGIVTLRGEADNQATAQRAVEAARQVPGVLRVDYDIHLRRQ